MKITKETFNKKMIAMRYWLIAKEYYIALKAFEYAANLHCGFRKDGVTPEFYHQLSIGHYLRSIISGLLFPEITLASAFLHDVSEDYHISFEYISSNFGNEVCKVVDMLTKKEIHDDSFYYAGICGDSVASVVKGADRAHNISSMVGVFSIDKQKQYIEETENYVLPMLKKARRNFPMQEGVYENLKYFLCNQIDLITEINSFGV